MAVILCILDGWGCKTGENCDAISNADTPNFDNIVNNFPSSKLKTSGNAVGLPEGQMGNSEVGHMTIGSGRAIEQMLVKIDKGIFDIGMNDDFTFFIENIKERGGKFHILGIISDGGVHGHINHVISMAREASDFGVEVIIHVITDGRDTDYNSAPKYLSFLEKSIKGYNAHIGSVMGRYYAMDRDNRIERTERAFELIVNGIGDHGLEWPEVINRNYNNSITDEFIEPSVVGDYCGVFEGDGIILANFRADRMRQISDELAASGEFADIMGMVDYNATYKIKSLFKKEVISNTLGEVINDAGKKQLRIAETEKYAHVTFFFNAGREEEFSLEDRKLIDSPKVDTYDKVPEMSAEKITDEVVKNIKNGEYDFIVINYANPDMVAHTGDMPSTQKAVEYVDKCLGRILDNIGDNVLIVTADHGNAEKMFDEEKGIIDKSHTTGPVPFIIVNDFSIASVDDGALSDIAPTILDVMKLDKPNNMTGRSLIKRVS